MRMREEADSDMEMFLLIAVLVVLIALFGYVAYRYMKEAGDQGPQLWLTGSQKLRQSLRSLNAASLAPGDSAIAPTADAPRQIAARDPLLALDDAALRQLKEEFQSELRLAAGRAREFDARLTRIESNADDAPRISTRVSEEIAGVREHQRVEIERLQVTLESVKQRAGSYGERRIQALAELYGSLARVESALAAVVNPMLLPGEPLTIPAELPVEAMDWNNWGDVGERAYALGNVFNENRLVLDGATGDEVKGFIATLRQGLTGSVYPNVRVVKPSAGQIAQMRSGLEAIVAELPNVRRQIEDAYRDDPR